MIQNQTSSTAVPQIDGPAPHFLLVVARFYEDVADELVKGAGAALERLGATFEVIDVPGVLEIPAALAFALSGEEETFEGFVCLGCVIRGETSHYDIVANESARAIMDLSTEELIAVGNGILTVETLEQAWARARVAEMDKGGGAALAAYRMVALRRRFGIDRG